MGKSILGGHRQHLMSAATGAAQTTTSISERLFAASPAQSVLLLSKQK
jgi:hypothetical protein